MVDDYWATAVKLFTGYPVPDRSTLFTNLTGDADHGKIPLLNVAIEQVKFSMSTVGGPNIDGHDYVIPFYIAGSDGPHSNAQPVLHRALIDFINANGVDIKSEGSEFGNVTDAFWSDSDDAALDGSPLGQYITGSVKALFALGFTPYSTQGLKVSGAAVPDASAVDMKTFSDTAKAFDRVTTFFSNHATTLQQWKDSLGKEQSAWKGKAAGVFWHLIDQLHKNYDNYVEQMHPGDFNPTSYSEIGGYASISKQGDALIMAEKQLLGELRQLHYVGAQWMSGTNSGYAVMSEDPTMRSLTGIANPYAIAYSLVSEIERWAATHNRTQVTLTISTGHKTIPTGYQNGPVEVPTSTKEYGTTADFKENFPGLGNLGAMSTWQAVGNTAVTRWNEGVDKFLVPQGKTSLSNVNNTWIRAQQVLDDVLTTKSTATLSSSYETDSTSAQNSDNNNDVNQQIKDIQDQANQAIDDANKAAQDAIDKANKAAQDAIDKANQAIKDAQDAAKQELKDEQDAANKAIDEANKAAKDAQDQANQAIKDAQDQANQAIKEAQDQANQQIQQLQDQLNGSTTTPGGDPTTLADRTLYSATDGPPADGPLEAGERVTSMANVDPTGANQPAFMSSGPPTTIPATSDTTGDPSIGGPAGVTVRNSDGSSTTTLPDGSQTTRLPNGTVTTTDPTGFTTTVTSDGTTTVQNPDGTVTTTKPDGTSTTTNPNGSSLTTNPDGSTTVTDPSGTSTTTFPNGTTSVTDTSGTTTTTNPDGTTTVTDPSGTITTGPDGITVTDPSGHTISTSGGPGSFTDGSGTTVTTTTGGSTTVTDGSGTTVTTTPDGSTTVTDPSGTTTFPGGGGQSTTIPPTTVTVPPTPPITFPGSTTTVSNPFTPTPAPASHFHATTPDGYALDESSNSSPLTTSYGVSPGNAFTGSADPLGTAFGTTTAGTALSPLQSAAAAQAGTTTTGSTSSPMMPPMGGGGGGGGGGRGDDSKNERVRTSGSAVLGRASGGGTSPRGGPLEEEEEFDEVPTTSAPFVQGGPAAGQGGQATQSGDRERSAWLTEEEDVWGTEEGTTPAVIGR